MHITESRYETITVNMQNNKHYRQSDSVAVEVSARVTSLIYVCVCYYEENKDFMRWMVKNFEDKKYLTSINIT